MRLRGIHRTGWEAVCGPSLAIAERLAAADWVRIAELVAICRGLPFGTADASVVAAAER